MHAFEIANKAGLTEEELEDKERREIYIQDQRGAQQLAESRGMEKGRLEVAKRMLEKGMTREEVAELAGLSADEMREIEK